MGSVGAKTGEKVEWPALPERNIILLRKTRMEAFVPRRRFRGHSRAKSPKVILQPPPTLAELKSELEGELRRIADFETRITTTREEGQKLQRIAEELGIDSLPVLFESC